MLWPFDSLKAAHADDGESTATGDHAGNVVREVAVRVTWMAFRTLLAPMASLFARPAIAGRHRAMRRADLSDKCGRETLPCRLHAIPQ
jgi:hypothetical protein